MPSEFHTPLLGDLGAVARELKLGIGAEVGGDLVGLHLVDIRLIGL